MTMILTNIIVMQATPRSILFVCLGNICRSPAAENTLRHLATERGCADQLVIDSAGTINYHKGKGPDPRMCETLETRGIPTQGSARQVIASDFEKFDLILAADHSNLDDLRRHPGAKGHELKIQLICDYCTDSSAQEVPDPYYGGQEGFEKVADLLEDACRGILDNVVLTDQ